MLVTLILLIIIAFSLMPKAVNAQQQEGNMLTATSDTTFAWTIPFKAADTTSLSNRINNKLTTSLVTGAFLISTLGFTPYNSTNPSGYISAADISGKANSANPVFTGTITQSSATIASQKYYLTPITTTNNTPVLLVSIPIPTNKSFDIDIYMMAVKSDGSTRNCGYIRGVFSRIAGNISQDGSLKNDLLGVLSTTKCTYVINNTAHTVEIYANGLTSTTINWNFFIEITNLL